MSAPQDEAPQTDDAGAAEVQAAVDAATERGYFGVSPDPTPRENYSIAGVISGKPTPETTPSPDSPGETTVGATLPNGSSD